MLIELQLTFPGYNVVVGCDRVVSVKIKIFCKKIARQPNSLTLEYNRC